MIVHARSRRLRPVAVALTAVVVGVCVQGAATAPAASRPTDAPGASAPSAATGGAPTSLSGQPWDAAAAPAAAAPSATGTTPTPWLPFDMPAAVRPGAGNRLVFVNYFTPHPLSLDNRDPRALDAQGVPQDYWNRNYLSPYGECDKYLSAGGFVRTRPEGVLPAATTDSFAWHKRNAAIEVREAIQAGIDGWYVDILSFGPTPDAQLWESTRGMLAAVQESAAAGSGFRQILMPDLSGGPTTTMGAMSASDMARNLANLVTTYGPAGTGSSFFTVVEDGVTKYLLMPTAYDVHLDDPGYWQQVIDIARTSHGVEFAVAPIFSQRTTQAQIQAYGAVAWGFGTWGGRYPSYYTNNYVEISGYVRAAGMEWVGPVSLQDERPRSYQFTESQNSGTLRASWKAADEAAALEPSGIQLVHVPTWNDYSETSGIAPTAASGWSWLDLNAYYLAHWKTGVWPTITRDAVVVSHRRHRSDVRPVVATPRLQTPHVTPISDAIEVVPFLTGGGSATVTVRVGSTVLPPQTARPPAAGQPVTPLSFALPAGGTGRVRVTVVRDGATLVDHTTATPVTTTPYQQDLSYVASSSLTHPAIDPAIVSLRDVTPPGRPVRPAVQQRGSATVLAWGRASDAVGVTHYNVYRHPRGNAGGRTLMGSTEGVRFEVPSTTAADYAWSVEAQDAAGNVSGRERARPGTVAPDVTPPTARPGRGPGAPAVRVCKVQASAVTGGVRVTWPMAVDNDLVTQYRIFRSSTNNLATASQIGTAAAPATGSAVYPYFTDSAPLAGASYYWVVPVDRSANVGEALPGPATITR